MARILLVEDDVQLAPVLKSDLEYEGYEVALAETVQKAKEAFAAGGFDLVILDVSLPDGTGYEICRHIRKTDEVVPVIFLTARSQEPDKVMGFKLGADDYVTKPFGVMELLARIKARLRSVVKKEQDDIVVGSLDIDRTKREVKVAGKPAELAPREFDILWLLASRKGQVVTRDDFLDNVWGKDVIVAPRTIDNQVGNVRHKLEAFGEAKCPEIQTVHKVGFKLVEK